MRYATAWPGSLPCMRAATVRPVPRKTEGVGETQCLADALSRLQADVAKLDGADESAWSSGAAGL